MKKIFIPILFLGLLFSCKTTSNNDYIEHIDCKISNKGDQAVTVVFNEDFYTGYDDIYLQENDTYVKRIPKSSFKKGDTLEIIYLLKDSTDYSLIAKREFMTADDKMYFMHPGSFWYVSKGDSILHNPPYIERKSAKNVY